MPKEICPNCKEPVREKQKFCDECGADLVAARYDVTKDPLKKIADLEQIVKVQGEEIEKLKKGGDEDGGEEGEKRKKTKGAIS